MLGISVPQTLCAHRTSKPWLRYWYTSYASCIIYAHHLHVLRTSWGVSHFVQGLNSRPSDLPPQIQLGQKTQNYTQPYPANVYQRCSIASCASTGIAKASMSVCLSVCHTPVLYLTTWLVSQLVRWLSFVTLVVISQTVQVRFSWHLAHMSRMVIKIRNC